MAPWEHPPPSSGVSLLDYPLFLPVSNSGGKLQLFRPSQMFIYSCLVGPDGYISAPRARAPRQMLPQRLGAWHSKKKSHSKSHSIGECPCGAVWTRTQAHGPGASPADGQPWASFAEKAQRHLTWAIGRNKHKQWELRDAMHRYGPPTRTHASAQAGSRR